MAWVQEGDFVVESSQQRLYNPKPRSYKYNMKNSSLRLEKLEKATEKCNKGASNQNKRESRVLGVILESLETRRDIFNMTMESQQQKLLVENRHRKITHKALQDSLKKGFLALNQFQNSGLRTKVVSDLEKQISPLKHQKRKLQKLSKKSLEESTAIGERNAAILNERLNPKLPLARLGDYRFISSLSTTPITIPTFRAADSRSTSTSGKNTPQKLVKTPKKKIPKVNHDDYYPYDSDDDYDEGGFTPRPKPALCSSSMHKLPKIPGIAREPSIFLTEPGVESP